MALALFIIRQMLLGQNVTFGYVMGLINSVFDSIQHVLPPEVARWMTINPPQRNRTHWQAHMNGVVVQTKSVKQPRNGSIESFSRHRWLNVTNSIISLCNRIAYLTDGWMHRKSTLKRKLIRNSFRAEMVGFVPIRSSKLILNSLKMGRVWSNDAIYGGNWFLNCQAPCGCGGSLNFMTYSSGEAAQQLYARWLDAEPLIC